MKYRIFLKYNAKIKHLVFNNLNLIHEITIRTWLTGNIYKDKNQVISFSNPYYFIKIIRFTTLIIFNLAKQDKNKKFKELKTMNKTNIQRLKWTDLSTDQLYDILHLRASIFIIEQDCAYLDVDLKDRQSEHFCLYEEGVLKAYLRIQETDDSFITERVCTAKEARGKGYAQQLIQYAMEEITDHLQGKTLSLNALVDLVDYYAQWGFVKEGEVYLDYGWEHQYMVYDADSSSNNIKAKMA